MDISRNLSMLMDLYELTMSSGYLKNGYDKKIAVFDMFFRRIPDGGGFAIAAGLHQFAELVCGFCFTDEDIEYLHSLSLFQKSFLDYLKNFKFTCTILAVPEGTPIFPNEPIVTVIGPIIEAQLIETLLLCCINHQSLIATKTNRIVRAAKGRPCLEFGARRAQGFDGANYGSRAAFIGGSTATSNVMAGQMFSIPVIGTIAHSWVQLFGNDYDAFCAYAKSYPDNCVLLVDTYSTLQSGIPAAIRVFDEILKPMGKRPSGVRIDSGDIAYLSKKARWMLDSAGYRDVKIIASNALNEYLVRDLLVQDAAVDSFGVGENLITASSEPVFGGVYKLVAVLENGVFKPSIKLSETVEKMTLPHLKTLYRIFDKETGFAEADLICLACEPQPDTPLTIFDPIETWKKRTYTSCIVRPLQHKIFHRGKLVYKLPDLMRIKSDCADNTAHLWDEVLRFENPHKYYVDLSELLHSERLRMLSELSERF